MHEKERHRLILSAITDRTLATISELCTLTGASEATIRRDIAALDDDGVLRRVRGGAQAIEAEDLPILAGRPFAINAALRRPQKVAIARAAAEMCVDDEPIIINGGTTTFEMVHILSTKRLKVLTNSLPIASHLIAHSRNQVLMPGGTIYREQQIILSSFQEDASAHFWGRRMFMGCQGLSPIGLMEADPLLIRAEEKLMARADELVVLADSSKFEGRSSLVLCPLQRIHTVITDDGVNEESVKMLEEAGIEVVIASTKTDPLSAAG